MNDLILAPKSVDEAIALSNRFAKSGLVPVGFRGKPDDILLVLMGGMELGFSPVQALRSFYVINGRLGMYADAMVALCVRSPLCEYFKLSESTDDHASYVTKRKGSEPVALTYTMAQAKQAGALKNATYTQHPAAMLRARCSAALARIAYPDLVAGLYDPQEFVEEEVRPEPVKAMVRPNEEATKEIAREVLDDLSGKLGKINIQPEPSPEPTGWDDEDVLAEHMRLAIENAKSTEELLKIGQEANKLPKGPGRDELRKLFNEKWVKVK